MNSGDEDVPWSNGSPPTSSLPLPGDTPLPHLTSADYFRSHSQSSFSPPNRRPPPPTPYRMMSLPTHAQSHRRHRSGIPQPACGSSRRATPTGQYAASNASASSDSTIRRPIPQQSYYRPWRSGTGPDDGNPPGSCSVSVAMPSRTDSLIPYTVRPTDRDLSGIRQQLQMRNFSIQSLASLDALSSTSNTTGRRTSNTWLPKSKTSTSLAQRVQNLTPQRTLMQPLGPPMPRSQTIGSMSCFAGAGVHNTPSPVKDFGPTDDVSPSKSMAGSQVDVIDALLESRMTDAEIAMLNQIKKEKQANEECVKGTMRTVQIVHRLEAASNTDHPEPFIPTSRSRQAIHLSANDIVNRSRLEEQHRRKDVVGEAKNRYLRINPAVANASRFSHISLPTPNSAGSIVHSQKEQRTLEYKYVQLAESVTYWTGRYMALCDNLRTGEACLISSTFASGATLLRRNSAPSIATRNESFEVAEHRRLESALAELRSCCRTEEALRSLEEFEKGLLNDRARLADALENTMAPRETPESQNTMTLAGFRRNVWLFGQTPGSGSASGRVSSSSMSNSQIVDTKPRDGGLIKSMTTGNLAALKPDFDSIHEKHTDCTALTSKIPQQIGQDPRLSLQTHTNSRLVRERQEQMSMGAEGMKRRFSKRVTPRYSFHDDKGGIDDTEATHLRHPVQCSVRSSGPDLRTGLATEYNSHLVRSSRAQRPATRSDRQSSGEIIKGILEGGIRGVRRMGRSLTGRIELDDLGQHVDHKREGLLDLKGKGRAEEAGDAG